MSMASTNLSSQILDDLDIHCERDVPLGPLTWYGIGGPVPLLAHPANVQQLSALAARCHETGTPLYVLGRGANLLVDDKGVSGVVMRLDAPRFKRFKIDGHTVTVGAGFDLAKLVLLTAKGGLGGSQCLAGIPATVGGAVRMNAGGKHGQIGHAVRRVMVCDAAGQVEWRIRDDLIFGYRKTNIADRYILEVELELVPEDPDRLIKQVKDIFRFKKNSQPLAEQSAGCAFKNPPPPAWRQSTPVSAGQLIDEAGLKGFRIGGAEVSLRHANFVITHRGCVARDVLALLEHIQQTVHERSGVLLEREIIVWS